MDTPDLVASARTAPLDAALGLAKAVVPYIPTYLHLIVAALFPIVTGAHAALQRPHSTLSLKDKKKLQSQSEKDAAEDDEEEEEPVSAVENLTASDALMFPVTAGLMLSALYFIIKWLEDPSILSTILTYYFGFVGVFAVGKAFSESLNVYVSYLFPLHFKGQNGKVFKAGYSSYKSEDGEELKNPLPIYLVPQRFWGRGWKLRRSLRARWQLVAKLHGSPSAIKKTFWIGDLIGLLVGPVAVGMYTLGGKHWLFTNIMGISFCYGAVQFLSATTFPIATLLLGLLFFYDIFFVFYTPLMVTVATNLDVPIKLLFPRPGTTEDGRSALSMLGLGDIVIPGIVITMALRYDLWRFYEQKRQGLVQAHRALVDDGKARPEDEKMMKPRYQKATGGWGERFWMNEGQPFPKPYFYSSIVGYTIGMLTTLMVMHVYKHAQPALLYLVPGVLSSVWGMAAYHGELSIMWHYSEEGEQEKEEREEKERKEKEKAGADKKAEKDKKKPEPKPEPIGEKDTEEYVNISIIRRPAPGTAAPAVKLTLEEPAVVDEAEEDTEEDTEEEGSMSGSSSSAVEVTRDGMWETTVLDEQK